MIDKTVLIPLNSGLVFDWQFEVTLIPGDMS